MPTLSSHLGSILLAIAGFTFWVLCDSAIKLAGQSRLPNYEIVAFLGAFMAMFLFLYAVARGEVTELWPKKPKRLLVRALLDVNNNLCVVIALRHLSLTLFYILVFTSPMMVAVFGRIFLKERLDGRKIAALLVGFLGVVVTVYPLRSNGTGDWVGVACCALCSTCFSAVIVWSRVIAQTEKPESMTFLSGLVAAGIGGAAMLYHAAPVTGPVLLALVAMGLLCGLGSVCIALALKHAAAATVSQYHYTQLVVGSLVAYVLFHEKPNLWMLAGAALIVAAGFSIALQAGAASVKTADATVMEKIC